MSERRVAALTAVVGGVALVLLAWWRVPWHPVPGGTPPPVAARSYFSAGEIARADHFSRWARLWSWSGLALTLALTAWLGFGGRPQRWWRRVRGPQWVRVVVLTVGVVAAGTLVALPSGIALWSLEHRHGISTQTWAGVVADTGISAGLTAAVTALALIGAMACARRLPSSWPAVVGAAAAAFVIIGSFVYPVVVEPLTLHTTSLPRGPLRTEIEGLAKDEGVQLDDVLVADASTRTTALNAYVSGFGSTRRVVLYDTTVQDLPERQIAVVVAHELGHAARDDVLTGTLLGAAAAMTAVGLLGLLTGWRRDRGSWPAVTDPAVVPVLIATVTLALFLADPVENLVSRDLETRADVASLRTTHDPTAFAAVQRRLALSALQDPTPPRLSQWWFGTHPTPLQRIALADVVG